MERHAAAMLPQQLTLAIRESVQVGSQRSDFFALHFSRRARHLRITVIDLKYAIFPDKTRDGA
jgi:hypothetical protein